MTKYKKIFLLFSIVIFAGLVFLVIKNLNIPSSQTAHVVKLGEEFTLSKGETARVMGLNVYLTLKDFIYAPCPPGAQCFWSGLAVVYELKVDGKVYESSWGNLANDAPYMVVVKNSDYKSYATFVIF